jgi:hypothetical protein
MANTLTNLVPTMYEALDIVSRERVGFIPAVSRDSSAERAALNQSILVPIVPATTAEAANTPGVTAPDTGDQTVGNVEITISKSYHIPVRWNGEETRGLNNAGTYQSVNRDRFVQAFRRLGNLIEADLASSYKYASRAFGTAGQTPFGTADNLSDFAGILRILDDNGAPPTDLKLVLSNAAMQNIRAKQSSLFKANEAGTDELLRDGKIMRVMGLDLGQSGQVATHVHGTTTDATLTSTDYAVGSTSLTLASAGTGTIVEGDMVNIAGENNGIRYGVRSGDADVSNGGTVVLNNPGLTIAQTTNTSVIAPTAANYSANLAFHKSAIQLVTRVPALPDGGDAATDRRLLFDSISGITFEAALYPQFLQNVVHIRVAWGWKAIKQEHIAVLLG